MTFCPWPVFKEKGFHFQKEDFDQHTFNIEEIFHPLMMLGIKNRSQFEIKPQLSLFYGKCFTLKDKVKLPIFSCYLPIKNIEML
jgi:hypothetical protein